jgi:hypothetical protein
MHVTTVNPKLASAELCINKYKFYMFSNALISVSVYDKSHPELGNLFQGDIILAKGRNALLVKEYLWPNGVVPYVFHSNYSKLLLKDQHKKNRWFILVLPSCNSIIFDTIHYNKQSLVYFISNNTIW